MHRINNQKSSNDPFQTLKITEQYTVYTRVHDKAMFIKLNLRFNSLQFLSRIGLLMTASRICTSSYNQNAYDTSIDDS